MKIKMNMLYLILVLVFIVFLITSFYFDPAVRIARGSGTVLSDNWWVALNWIKNNTPECAVVATYWDPGHFITAIAKRPVVFDGASQNAVLIINKEGNLSDEEIKSLAPTGKYTAEKKVINGTIHTIITRARIQDIGTTLFTDNETLAYEILKAYRKPDCKEMYYLATSDLVGKAHWWTYFATWNPVDKGAPSNYLTLTLTQVRPAIQQNAIAYTYALSQDQAFVIFDRNGTLQPFLQQGNQFAEVQKIFYISKTGEPLFSINNDAQVKGLLWLDASRQVVVFIPPELENSLFTRMFFFNGAGLEKFKFVNSWGGEVKLFKITFD